MASVFCAILPLSAQTRISPDPAKTQQDFEGWGISLCWWGNQVGRWSDANLIPLIDIVVNPDTGLGYTLFRYNIGGGDNPGHTHLSAYKALPGFKATETGPYNWLADPYQRKVATLLQARGRNTIFEAFSNSPPWWMTKNQCSGGMEDGSDNLKPDYFEAFADYLTDVIKHLQDSSGFRFRTLEPLNESSSNWWTGTDQTQEGCGFANNQAKLMKLLAVKIKDRNLSVGISAADENSISLALSGLQKYDDSALSILAQLNTHSYSGWEKRKEYGQKAISLKKRLWMSESGPLNRPAGGNLLDLSLWMADMIIKDVKEMQANAWIDWQLIDASANWRSIEANQTAQTFAPNKRFYMHCNFSRFIRPGAKILQSPVENTLAAQVPQTGNLVVVVLNPEAVAKAYAIDVSLFPDAAGSGSVYSTNATDNLKKLADIAVQAGMLTATVSAKSITTFVIQVAKSSSLLRPISERRGKSWRMQNGNGAGSWPGFPWGQGEFDANGRSLGQTPGGARVWP